MSTLRRSKAADVFIQMLRRMGRIGPHGFGRNPEGVVESARRGIQQSHIGDGAAKRALRKVKE